MDKDKKEFTELEISLLDSLDVSQDLKDGLLSGEKTIEDFNTHKNDTFVARKMASLDESVVKSVIGKFSGEIDTNSKRLFSFKSEDMEGLKSKDIVTKGVEILQNKIKELEEASSNTNDDKSNALQKSLDELTSKHEVETAKSMDLAQKLETEVTARASDIKGFNISTKINDIKRKIDFKSDLSNIERTGFESHLKDKFQFDLDDNKNLVVKDSFGELIKNDKGTDFMNVEDVLTREAKNNNLLKMNDGNSQAKPVNHQSNGKSDKPQELMKTNRGTILRNQIANSGEQ